MAPTKTGSTSTSRTSRVGAAVPRWLSGPTKRWNARQIAYQVRRVCFCASCLTCFAARFSLRVRLGFLGSLDGVDLVAMCLQYGDRDAAAARLR